MLCRVTENFGTSEDRGFTVAVAEVIVSHARKPNVGRPRADACRGIHIVPVTNAVGQARITWNFEDGKTDDVEILNMPNLDP
jgi:hypothetical protein